MITCGHSHKRSNKLEEGVGKKAFITGIAGQDGRYLAEYLLSLGYSVVGLIHTQRPDRQEALLHEIPQLEFDRGDLIDGSSLVSVLHRIKPDEIYNLGALSFVGASWDQAVKYAIVTGVGVLNLLSAMRQVIPDARFYQASSSEMFGKVQEVPQTEITPFYPRSPYGIAKETGHRYTVNFRESFGMFTCGGILFNHESPRRGTEFVTRKITRAVARIRYDLQADVELGNLASQRDWGFAGDYVQAMHLMLQQGKPDDYVIATGEVHSVQEFTDLAFVTAGIPIHWEFSPAAIEEGYQSYLQMQEELRKDPNVLPKVRQEPPLSYDAYYHLHEGLGRIGIRDDNGQVVVRVSEKFFRPAEVELLQGDASKARRVLGWEPKVSFSGLVAMMVEHDLREQRDQIKD